MPLIETKLKTSSEAYKASATAMHTLVQDLQQQIAQAAEGGGEAARAKHKARGKLLPRERIAALLDPDTPFLEFSSLAAHDMYNNDSPGAGIITGLGRIAGHECMIICNDATVKGGT